MSSLLSQQIQPFHVMELVKAADQLAQQGRSVLHLSIGEPDFGPPKAVLHAFQTALQEGKTGYTSALGLWPLRAAVAQHYQDSFGVKVRPEQVVITGGASAALQYACLALINPGDEVLITDPGYPCNKTFVQTASGVPVAINTQEALNFEPDVGALHHAWGARTRGALLASPNNPTGTRLSEGRLADVVELIKQRQGFLIMDEIYQQLSHDGPARSIVQTTGAPDDSWPLMVVNSFSKFFGMTGLRLGWLLAPMNMISTLEKLAQNLAICPSTPAQWAALACFTPESLAECEARRLEFQARRDWLLVNLHRAGMTVRSKPDSAFYVYTRVPSPWAGRSDEYCQALLNEEGVCTVPGKDFSPENGHSMVRLSYANSLNTLQECIGRMERFYARHSQP
ncbi:MAG: aminotransferase class I/II-fold pyridoxal phosphate-dependent enzyme [Limnobacter sp.]|uniref:aminotransferase class I/II-fold pyridoxal phosphate-dependent enzyme n=1 Tax=Limnobacter sp. TaxID=2003368 RepID=UPI00391DFD4A